MPNSESRVFWSDPPEPGSGPGDGPGSTTGSYRDAISGKPTPWGCGCDVLQHGEGWLIGAQAVDPAPARDFNHLFEFTLDKVQAHPSGAGFNGVYGEFEQLGWAWDGNLNQYVKTSRIVVVGLFCQQWVNSTYITLNLVQGGWVTYPPPPPWIQTFPGFYTQPVSVDCPLPRPLVYPFTFSADSSHGEVVWS